MPSSTIFSRSPKAAILIPEQKSDTDRILTNPFFIGSIPMITLDTSIPEAIIVSSVPNTALSEKVRIIGMDRVSMKPIKMSLQRS